MAAKDSGNKSKQGLTQKSNRQSKQQPKEPCSKCRKQAILGIEYAGKKYCESHFLELMEKRVRKNLRVRELIDVKSRYCLVDDGSCEAKLTEYFLNRIFQGYLQTEIKNDAKQCSGTIIVPTNLDEQALLFLNSFLNEKDAKGAKKAPYSSIMPLEVLLQSEVEILCRILSIEFKPRIKKNILDELEIRHKGTKFSLFQSRMNVLGRINK